VRLANDADMHGYAAVKGEGLEMVATLGTGFGTSLFRRRADAAYGNRHMPACKGKTFPISISARRNAKSRVNEGWNRRFEKMLPYLYTSCITTGLHQRRQRQALSISNCRRTPTSCPNNFRHQRRAGTVAQKEWK